MTKASHTFSAGGGGGGGVCVDVFGYEVIKHWAGWPLGELVKVML